ncbi:MAG TPA: hypothetical protein VHC97_18660 [Thermoanaerobaculia bacterium]|jgi:hypothetical protein|nr:hypothetical protein [Thermoanaerobaculia bacterium]
MPEELGYRVNTGEPGIFVEIYLPKRSELQGSLYDTLTRGFDIEAVREHFRDPEKKERIRELFRHYDPELAWDEERTASLREVFFGYSMYEVDGVFRGGDGPRAQEERNQILRVIFKPDYPGIAERSGASVEVVREMAAERLHAYRDTHEPDLKSSGGRSSGSEKQVTEEIRLWMEDVALFLFGYVVYELCERLAELYEEGARRPEEEIWVTSFWALTINRVVNLR